MRISLSSRLLLILFTISFISCQKSKNVKSTNGFINANIEDTDNGIKISFVNYGGVDFSNKLMLDGWHGLATRQNDSIYVLISSEDAYRLIEPPIGRVKVIVMDPYQLHDMYKNLLDKGTLNIDTIEFDNHFE